MLEDATPGCIEDSVNCIDAAPELRRNHGLTTAMSTVVQEHGATYISRKPARAPVWHHAPPHRANNVSNTSDAESEKAPALVVIGSEDFG